MRKTHLAAVALLFAGACRLSDMEPDASVGVLRDTSIARAVAGDPGWPYTQRVSADFDADGISETAVVISDVTLDRRGRPIWEDGHRWQVYIEEPTGERTYLFRRFLPNGQLQADVVRRESGTRALLLVARTPTHLSVYEVKYSGPERIVLVNGLDRQIEAAAQPR
jgi:hypothetical protein